MKYALVALFHLVAIGFAAPAMACQFDQANSTLSIPSVGDYDPYESSSVNAAISVDLSGCSGTHFLAISTAQSLANGGASMSYALSTNLAVDPGGRSEIPDGTTQITVTATIDPQAQVPTSGLYAEGATLSIFANASGGAALSSLTLTSDANVASVMTISITGTGAGGTISFGTLTEGASNTASANVLATSNDPHGIRFLSSNDWSMTLSATENGATQVYSIPYSVTASGTPVSATNPDFLLGLNATSNSGVTHALEFSATPQGNLRAGDYSDQVTVTIVAPDAGL